MGKRGHCMVTDGNLILGGEHAIVRMDTELQRCTPET